MSKNNWISFKIVPQGHHNCQLSIVNCQFGRSPLNIPILNLPRGGGGQFPTGSRGRYTSSKFILFPEKSQSRKRNSCPKRAGVYRKFRNRERSEITSERRRSGRQPQRQSRQPSSRCPRRGRSGWRPRTSPSRPASWRRRQYSPQRSR